MAELLGYHFRNALLAEAALRHPSLPGKRPAGMEHFERLEFLGDRVLGLVIANWLLQLFPAEAEGALTRRHTSLVRAGTLAAIARDIGLGQHLRLAANEGAMGLANENVLADAMEAALGAIFIDGGLAAAEPIIRQLWQARMTSEPTDQRDAKTRLQEWAQARGPHLPQYSVVSQSGPPHAPQFKVAVKLADGRSAQGDGSSKRIAEQEAAAALLMKVGENG